MDSPSTASAPGVAAAKVGLEALRECSQCHACQVLSWPEPVPEDIDAETLCLMDLRPRHELYDEASLMRYGTETRVSVGK